MKLADISGKLEHVLLELNNGVVGEGRLLVRAIALTGQAICAAGMDGKVEVDSPALTPSQAVAVQNLVGTAPYENAPTLDEMAARVQRGQPPRPTVPPKRVGRPAGSKNPSRFTSKFPPTFKQQGLLKYLAGQSGLGIADLDALAIEEARESGGADAKFVTGWFAMSGKIASRVIDRLKQDAEEQPQDVQPYVDEPDPQF